MKAHYMSTREQRILQTALQAADDQAQDIERRAGYMWSFAMLQAGLSARTVNRVAALVPEVKAIFKEYKEDKLADFAFVSKLNDAGVEAIMPETEI